MTPSRLAEIRQILDHTPATGTVPARVAAELLAVVDELREPDEPVNPPESRMRDVSEGLADEPAPRGMVVAIDSRTDEPVLVPCLECDGKGYRVGPDHGRRICGACRAWE